MTTNARFPHELKRRGRPPKQNSPEEIEAKRIKDRERFRANVEANKRKGPCVVCQKRPRAGLGGMCQRCIFQRNRLGHPLARPVPYPRDIIDELREVKAIIDFNREALQPAIDFVGRFIRQVCDGTAPINPHEIPWLVHLKDADPYELFILIAVCYVLQIPKADGRSYIRADCDPMFYSIPLMVKWCPSGHLGIGRKIFHSTRRHFRINIGATCIHIQKAVEQVYKQRQELMDVEIDAPKQLGEVKHDSTSRKTS